MVTLAHGMLAMSLICKVCSAMPQHLIVTLVHGMLAMSLLCRICSVTQYHLTVILVHGMLVVPLIRRPCSTTQRPLTVSLVHGMLAVLLIWVICSTTQHPLTVTYLVGVFLTSRRNLPVSTILQHHGRSHVRFGGRALTANNTVATGFAALKLTKEFFHGVAEDVHFNNATIV